jgi:hypothetical protein
MTSAMTLWTLRGAMLDDDQKRIAPLNETVWNVPDA